MLMILLGLLSVNTYVLFCSDISVILQVRFAVTVRMCPRRSVCMRPHWVVQWKGTRIAWRPLLKHVASPHDISIPLHCRGIPGALAVKLLSRALKQTELTHYVTNGNQLQQRPRACGPVISAVARPPPGSVSTPTEKHIDNRDPSDHDGSIDDDEVCVYVST